MNHFKPEAVVLLAVTTALVLLSAACVVVNEGPATMEHSAQTVDAKGAQSVHVEIDMGAGELQVRGGAAPLMDADFRYRASDGRPEVTYDVSGSRGTLTVRQPSRHTIGGNSKNIWELRLNEDVPMDLSIKMGAGEGRLNLGSVALHSLTI